MKFIPSSFALLVCCVSAFFQNVIGNPNVVCLVNGERYNNEASVGDRLMGCHECFCLSGGYKCNGYFCEEYEPLDCKIQGQHYKHFEKVPPSDDCQSCLCLNGNLACGNCKA